MCTLFFPLLYFTQRVNDTDDFPPEEEQEAAIKLRMKQAALKALNEKYAFECTDNEFVGFLKKDLENEISTMRQRLDSLECDETDVVEVEQHNAVLLDLYEIQRKELFNLRQEKKYSDEELRKQERQIDYEEAKLSPFMD